MKRTTYRRMRSHQLVGKKVRLLVDIETRSTKIPKCADCGIAPKLGRASPVYVELSD